MNIVFEMLIKFWYLWILIIAAEVLELYMPKIKGYLGEKSVTIILSELDETKYRVINDIILHVGNKTIQIDHIVISIYGIFVIETKDYKGQIIGNEFDDNWKQVIYGRKEKLQNPLKQCYEDIQALKEILNDFQNIKYISIVTFTTKAELKIVTTTEVVYTVNLYNTIKKYDSENITNSIIDKICLKLVSLNVDSKKDIN